MTRLLYNLLWPLGLIFFLPGYLLKMIRRGGYRANFGQRLGFYSPELRQTLRTLRPTWIHAVSVGEVAIALKLAAALRPHQPGLEAILTVTTTTGYAFACNGAPPWLRVLYAPLDFWPVMHHAWNTIKPRRVILVEAEVWPNLMAEARRRAVPVILANARLSPRSETRFRRFHALTSPLFRKLTLVCVADVEEKQRWLRLGVAEAKIAAVGNIKYDTEETFGSSQETAPMGSRSPAIPQASFTEAIRHHEDSQRRVLLGGSTHPGEEKILAEVFRQLRPAFPDLLLVLAPRHVERVSQIEADLRDLRAVRRSAFQSLREIDCLLIDTTGELRDWYRIATVVFIGKSLTSHGGQNPAEAILAGKPILFGPHMENFASLSKGLLAAGGARCVQSVAELVEEVQRLLANQTLREHMAQSGLSVLAPHRGATARTAEAIELLGR
ncbi:MAG: 3-deoxy-D-manno-octulosonic acid transferase [Verrucomicrobiota bacterium]